MSEFLNISVNSTPSDLAGAVYDAIRVRWPDWEPADGNLETWLIEAFSRLAAESGVLMTAVAQDIFQYFGESVLNLPVIPSSPATYSTTWTMVDNAGYTIPGGTQVAIAKSGDELIGFETTGDVTVPPGSTTTGAGAVTLRAVVEGTNANGLTAVPSLIDALAFVSSIALVAQVDAGVDGEDEDTYTNRLSSDLSLLSPRPILPSDFEKLARNIVGVTRAKAIDGWDAVTPATGQDRYIGIVALDAAGEDVAAPIKTALVAYLDGLRETNFVVTGGSPTYSTIDVTCDVSIFDLGDPTIITGGVAAALTDYLQPYNWGRFQIFPDPTTWDENKTKVRYTDLITVVRNVNGVKSLNSLTFRKSPAAFATTDITLTGTVPVTRPGVMTVTHS